MGKIRSQSEDHGIVAEIVMIFLCGALLFGIWYVLSSSEANKNHQNTLVEVKRSVDEQLNATNTHIVKSFSSHEFEVRANGHSYYAYVNPSDRRIGVLTINEDS